MDASIYKTKAVPIRVPLWVVEALEEEARKQKLRSVNELCAAILIEFARKYGQQQIKAKA